MAAARGSPPAARTRGFGRGPCCRAIGVCRICQEKGCRCKLLLRNGHFVGRWAVRKRRRCDEDAAQEKETTAGRRFVPAAKGRLRHRVGRRRRRTGWGRCSSAGTAAARAGAGDEEHARAMNCGWCLDDAKRKDKRGKGLASRVSGTEMVLGLSVITSCDFCFFQTAILSC